MEIPVFKLEDSKKFHEMDGLFSVVDDNVMTKLICSTLKQYYISGITDLIEHYLKNVMTYEGSKENFNKLRMSLMMTYAEIGIIGNSELEKEKSSIANSKEFNDNFNKFLKEKKAKIEKDIMNEKKPS